MKVARKAPAGAHYSRFAGIVGALPILVPLVAFAAALTPRMALRLADAI